MDDEHHPKPMLAVVSLGKRFVCNYDLFTFVRLRLECIRAETGRQLHLNQHAALQIATAEHHIFHEYPDRL